MNNSKIQLEDGENFTLGFKTDFELEEYSVFGFLPLEITSDDTGTFVTGSIDYFKIGEN